MRTGSQWKLFWKSRSPVKRLKTTRCRLQAFMRIRSVLFFASISLSHQYFNSNHSCRQILVEPELGPGWRLRFPSQQHLVRVWQQDAAERRTGRWGQSFHYVGKGSLEFLPTAGLCCWCYVASVRERGDREGTGKRSRVAVRKGGGEKKKKEAEENEKRRRPDEPSAILSSSAAAGYLATPSGCLQVAPSWQQGRVGAAAAADRQQLRPFTVPPWAVLCWNMTHIRWLTRAASQTGGGCVRVEEHAHGGASGVIIWIHCIVHARFQCWKNSWIR